ncbi:replication protein A 70 kDa DNA-binding subunit C-like protein [Tanacetum coccineum]
MSTKPAGTSLSTKIADMAAPLQSNPPLFLDELKVDGTGSIIVMVGRVWDVNATTGRYLSMNFVVSDSKRNMIKNLAILTAKATILHNFLRLKEGGIFLIKNFAILPNTDEFRVFRHDMFMLEFDGSTTIRKVSTNSVGFVRYTFQLVDFADIELTNNKYMIDVSGYVTNVGRTTYTKSDSKTLDFYLANQRRQSLRVTLWGGVGDSLIEKKTAHVGMCAIMLTSMTVKTYNNKLYLSSTSSMVIYDNDDISSLQELRSVTSLVEPNKEMMMVDSSQPKEGTVENLLLYRLEVVVDDDTAHTVVVMFNEIATELLNCSVDSLIEAEDEVGFCYLFQPHSYIDTNLYIQSAEDDSGLPTAIRNLIDDEASSSNQLITVDDSEPSFKRLTRQPSVCTLSKPNEEKSKKRSELEDSDTDEVLCSAKDPHEINNDGHVDKKKRKMRIDEDSDSVYTEYTENYSISVRLASKIYKHDKDIVTPSLSDSLKKSLRIHSNTTIRQDGRVQSNYGLTIIEIDAGCLDLFITFTLNPKWPEIAEMLAYFPGQKAHDRPEVGTRVFKLKLTELLDDLTKKHVFGQSEAVVYVIEFQKRGLPHVHILLWLEEHSKCRTPSELYDIISAELPSPTDDPAGYKVVIEYMLHGPCGKDARYVACTNDGKCSKHFPKPFLAKTFLDEKGYC